MDTRYIIAFVQAIQNVFKTMLKIDVSFGKPYVKPIGALSNGVSGIIGFTGSIRGSIVACFPLEVASKLTLAFTGTEIAPSHPDFADAIGELVNMVAGGAKTQFNQPGVSLGCPSVIVGREHQIFQEKDAPVVVVPCACGSGAFVIEVALKSEQEPAVLGNVA